MALDEHCAPGRLIIEVHSEQFVRALADGGRSWYIARESVFSDDPHLCSKECLWHPEQRVATERYFVVYLKAGDITTYVSTTQGCTGEEYAMPFRQAGFSGVERYPSLSREAGREDGLVVLVACAGAGV